MDDIARDLVSFGPFRLHSQARLLEKNGRPITVGSRALDLLIVLVEHAGAVVPKRDLMSRAWPGLTVDEGSLRIQIAALRKALADGVEGARYISNVPGRGYCFVMPTSTNETPTEPAEPVRLLRPQALWPTTNMIGRDETVQKVTLHLHAHRFVTIHGPGGVGKTTVAISVANAEAAAFDGNVVFIDLSTIKDPSLVAAALASALGLLVDTSDPTPSILEMLKDTRALVVLDSCEHVVEQVASLGERLHKEAPSVGILATSREPLRAAGEHVVQLSPLELPPRYEGVTAAQVLQFSAARLFAERASAAGLDAQLCDTDAAILVEMCHALDGLPLAIEIAASRAGRHGLAETAQLLNGRFRLLWHGRRNAPPRHQTLYATLDWSFALLSPPEQIALQHLSVFAGYFAFDAAQSIACDDMYHQGFIGEALEDLVAKSMISVHLSSGGARYRLLDTTRTYAWAKLVESGDVRAISARHAHYVADRLANIDLTDLASGVVSHAATDLLGDLRAALYWAFSDQGDRALALRLTAVSAALLIHFSLFDECGRWIERARSILNDDEHGGILEMNLDAAYGTVLILTQDNGERAQAAIERAMAVAERLGDVQTEFRMLYRLQLLYRRTGAFDRLLPLARQTEVLAKKIGAPHCVTSALAMVGSSHALAGDQLLAHRYIEQALEAQIAAPPVSPADFAYVGDLRIGLSLTLWLRGLPDQAARATDLISVDSPSALFSCMGLAWSAVVFREIGDHTAAERLVARLREKAQRYSLAPYQAVAMGLAGQTLLRRGEFSEAIERLQEAIELLRARQYGLYVSIVARSLAMALAEAGRTAEARRTVQVQIERIQSIGGAYDLPEWLRLRGEVEAQAGEIKAAEATFRSSIELAQQQSALSWRLRCETSLARLLLEHGRGEEASARLESALALFEEGFATHDVVSASHLLEQVARAISR